MIECRTLPFGPCLVCFDEINPEIVSKTLEYVNLNEASMKDMRKSLAGKLKWEKEFTWDDCVKMSPLLEPYIEKYLETVVSRLDDRLDWSYITDGNWEIEWQSLWINKQKAGEYNPIHAHQGDISFVYYPYVDERIEHEENISTGGEPGAISFMTRLNDYYRDDLTNASTKGTWRNALDSIYAYQFKPKTGMMFMFPSYLNHCVEAFYGDYDRFSVSGNIFLKRKENES